MGNVHSRHKPSKKEDAVTNILVGILACISSFIPALIVIGLNCSIFQRKDGNSASLNIWSVIGSIAITLFFGYVWWGAVSVGIEAIKEGITGIKNLRVERDESNASKAQK